MNALLEELKNTSVLLQTHWDETRNLWDDCVRDRVEKAYIKTFRDTIVLCLKGQYGSTYVYGRGMIEFFAYIESAAQKLSLYSEEKTSFDTTGEHARTVRYSANEQHKKPFSDEAEEDMMVNYDNYPKPS